MKKLYLAGIVIGLAVLLVVADYFALFGTRTTSHFDFFELRFKTVDEKTGAPVIDVHVRCFQQGNENACTEKDTHKPGILSVNVPVTKHITRTWLFEKNVSIQETRDPEVHIMFIHHDYARPVETFQVQELPELSRQQMTISMPRHILYKDDN